MFQYKVVLHLLIYNYIIFMFFTRYKPTQSPSLEDFILQKQLGKGTYGLVSKYIHKQSLERFAIKKISFKDRGQRDMLMIQKQLQILYGIRSEYIVQLIDHFQITDKSQVYLIMQYIQGGDLHRTVFNKKIQLSLKEITTIIYQIALGLQELHSNGIIHRDLKLQNVIYLPNGRIKLVDLGCGNFYGNNLQRTTNIGTKIYYSPELVMADPQDDRLDIWCLAVILYELLFGMSPFRGADMEDKIKRLKYQIPIDYQADQQLRDFFSRSLCYKQQRMRANDVLNHPWIIKHVDKAILDNNIERLAIDLEGLDQYKQFLLEQIVDCEGDIQKLKQKNQKLRQEIERGFCKQQHPGCF